MDWYATVKRHYDASRYNNANVATFVVAGKITPEQYKTITGEDYEASA
ncbi:MAG: XkdX family protein [Candidatus Cohnella colombiensis]|uniref:XkdX family protein n=1 Tax=Candidatus Cohnella colombiensis TaxID=3121368 RepID=A0AA95ETV8_9BACL|nr:MAG: XkdX family protein [Cohnella sp.]